jgi:hypothetical protein
MSSATNRGGASRKRVKGVCAVCRVDAGPDHWHTASHLERAAAWERAHEADRRGLLDVERNQDA